MKRWAWLFAVPVLLSVAAAQIVSSLNSRIADSQTIRSQGGDWQRQVLPSRDLPGASSQSSSQGNWHDADSGDRMFFPRDMFWGWAQFDLAPPHNEIDPNLCAGQCRTVRRRQRALQPLRALHALGNSGGSSVRPRSAAQVHGVRSADIPVRQDDTEDALHLVAGRDRNRALLGSRDLHRQGIRVSRDPTLPVRSSRRARQKPGRRRPGQQRTLGTLHDGGRAKNLRHAKMVEPHPNSHLRPAAGTRGRSNRRISQTISATNSPSKITESGKSETSNRAHPSL